MDIYLRTTGVACHMGSHNVACHPTQANTPRLNPSQWRLVLDLPTPEGWKAELTLVAGYIPRWFTRPHAVTHPSTNRARRRVTTLMRPMRYLWACISSVLLVLCSVIWFTSVFPRCASHLLLNCTLCHWQPERIDPPDPRRPDYDIRADVWSLGLSLVL